jgi:hypothetical protein
MSSGSSGVGQGRYWFPMRVVLIGPEHAQDDVAAAAGEADERGVVAFAFGSFAVVTRSA